MFNSNLVKKGFTLIELIIVIAIIAILASAIFVALDPARRLHEARNARRSSDVVNILDALVKYKVDNEGTNLTTVAGIADDKYRVIGTGATCAAATTGTALLACANATTQCLDISGLPTNYLGRVPYDPSTGAATNTRYYVAKLATGALVVGACDEEGAGAGGTGTAPDIELIR